MTPAARRGGEGDHEERDLDAKLPHASNDGMITASDLAITDLLPGKTTVRDRLGRRPLSARSPVARTTTLRRNDRKEAA